MAWVTEAISYQTRKKKLGLARLLRHRRQKLIVAKEPSMTMDFRVFDPALLRSLKPGQKVGFEIAEESAGEYIIVRIQPADLSLGATAHGGH